MLPNFEFSGRTGGGGYNCNYIVTSITKSVVELHNYLAYGREFGPKNNFYPDNFTDNDWRK